VPRRSRHAARGVGGGGYAAHARQPTGGVRRHGCTHSSGVDPHPHPRSACAACNFPTSPWARLLDLEKKCSSTGRRTGCARVPLVSPSRWSAGRSTNYARELAQVRGLDRVPCNGAGNRILEGLPDPILEPLETIGCKTPCLEPSENRGSRAEDGVAGGGTSSSVIPRSSAASESGRNFWRRTTIADLFASRRSRCAVSPIGPAILREGTDNRIANGETKRAGLLATKLDSGRANRKRPGTDQGDRGTVFAAGSDRRGCPEGDVRIPIIGFDDGSETSRTSTACRLPRSTLI